jgi:hypothetical protein
MYLLMQRLISVQPVCMGGLQRNASHAAVGRRRILIGMSHKSILPGLPQQKPSVHDNQ